VPAFKRAVVVAAPRALKQAVVAVPAFKRAVVVAPRAFKQGAVAVLVRKPAAVAALRAFKVAVALASRVVVERG
jgi:hypothetical protein